MIVIQKLWLLYVYLTSTAVQSQAWDICHYFDTNDVNIAPGVGRNKSTITTFFADQLGKAGGDYYTTYFPQPTWLTSRNYFLHYTGSNYAVLDFRHPQFFEMFVEGDTGAAEWHFQVQFF